MDDGPGDGATSFIIHAVVNPLIHSGAVTGVLTCVTGPGFSSTSTANSRSDTIRTARALGRMAWTPTTIDATVMSR